MAAGDGQSSVQLGGSGLSVTRQHKAPISKVSASSATAPRSSPTSPNSVI